MERKQDLEVEAREQAKLEEAKARLLDNAQALTFRKYVEQHPAIALAGAFFTGILLGGSLNVKEQIRDMTMQTLKKDLLRKLFK
mgnify:CR=1 FL=1